MDAFYSCGKRQRMPASQSWLTHNPPVIKTANTALSTAAKIRVCRHPFMAGVRHKYFLQIFILYHIARDVRWAHFSQSPGVCQGTDSSSSISSNQGVCFSRTPLRLHSSATEWTQLSEGYIFVLWLRRRDDGLIDLLGDPSLPPFLPPATGPGERQGGMTVTCLNVGYASG